MNFRLNNSINFLTVCKIYLVIGLCLLTFGVSAQNISEYKVSLSVENQSISLLFKAIESQTPFTFVLNQNIIDDNSSITLSFENSSLEEILSSVSKRLGLQFKQIKSTISVTTDLEVSDQNDFRIKGKVFDSETNEPLIGATVVAAKTTNGNITGLDGDFSFFVSAKTKELTVSFVGYASRSISMGSRSYFEIALEPELEQLGEVVIIGYGTQKSTSISGSVSSLSTKAIRDFPVTSVDQALTGQMAGVQITQNSGSPGSPADIDIRGVSTLTAGSQPLIVVDGMPLSTGNSNINFINPSEIESISVLKDAASAAIYGSRGANGVIIITTKRGRAGKPSFTVNSYTGFQRVSKKVDVMDAYERAQFIATARNNSWVENDPVNHSASDPGSVRPPNLRVPDAFLPYLEGQKGLVNTDWQEEIFRQASIQSHEISASGGFEGFSYFVSGSYFNQQGVVINSGFERYSLRMNLDAQLSDKLKLSVNLAPSFSLSDQISEEDHKGDGVIFTSLLANPIISARRADGSVNLSEQITFANSAGLTPTENPLALALIPSNNFRRSRFISGISLKYYPIESLEIKSYFGADLTYSKEHYFKPSILGSYGVPAPNQPLSRDESEDNFNWIFENTANYDLKLGEHNLTFLVGVSMQKEIDEYLSAFGDDFPNDFIQTANGALQTSGYSFITQRALLSAFGRFNYDFDEKYIVSASLRSDGFSAFGANNRWALFPAASFAWRISEESFLKENTFVSDFKLRASWGVTGNNQIPDFGGLALLQNANAVIDGNVVAGFSSGSSPNQNLSWEETSTIDIGLDVELFNGKVTFTGDLFRSETQGLLLNVPVPGHSGYIRSLQNIGRIQNQGIELSLGFRNHIGDFYISSNVNFSTAENKVLDLGSEQTQIAELLHITQINEPIGSYYGYRVMGVFQNEEQLSSLASDPRAEVGSYIYEDLDGDGEITDNDRTILGDFFPDYTFGFTTQMEYKNFDLSFVIQGKQGYEIFNGLSFFLLNEEGWGNASARIIDDYFVEGGENSNVKYAKPRKSPTDKLYEKSDLMVEDGSYIRVRNVSVGYTLTKKKIPNFPLTSCRVYLSANNPFTFTKYSGYNPEVSSGNTSWNRNPTTPGVDYGAYPLAKTYVVGININF